MCRPNSHSPLTQTQQCSATTYYFPLHENRVLLVRSLELLGSVLRVVGVRSAGQMPRRCLERRKTPRKMQREERPANYFEQMPDELVLKACLAPHYDQAQPWPARKLFDPEPPHCPRHFEESSSVHPRQTLAVGMSWQEFASLY